MADATKLITWTRVNATGGYDTLLPRTIASQVFVDSSNTVADHVDDDDIHLSQAERAALTATNAANGYVTLDANGFIPTSKLNPTALAVNIEYATIAAMLAAQTTAVAEGQLVMVTDASADTTVGSGWAIYRRKAGTTSLASLDNWQKIAEAESIDVTVSWANISGKPTSTTTAIDQAVTDSHTHENKDILDDFTDDGDGVLMYGEKTVAFTDAVTDFVFVAAGSSVPSASSLKEGDFVLVETSAS